MVSPDRNMTERVLHTICFRRICGGALSSAKLVVISGLVFLFLQCGGAFATMPKNPERSLSVATCKEALARIREAAEGSPLLSSGENKRQLLKAIEAAQRLCVD